MVKSVFISSTSLDLSEHRAAVDKAIRRLGLRPINMDDFGSQPGGASGVSLREVGKADVFVGIIAHRYGYVPEGMVKSVTEQEYDEAVKRRVPRLMYLLDPTADWPEDRVEADETAQTKLAAFRAKIEKNEVRSLFRTPEDLAAQMTADLTKVLDKGKRGQLIFQLTVVAVALLGLLLVGLLVMPESQRQSIMSQFMPPTPNEGEPAKEGEIVVVVAQFERNGTEHAQEIDMREVLGEAARQVGNVRVIAIGHPIRNREEAQAVSDVYRATMVVYGRTEPGGVRSSYEITPRFGELEVELEGDFRISSTELENFDAFLFNGMDSAYILGLTVGQLYYYNQDYESAISLFSLAANSLRSERQGEVRAYTLYFYRGNAYRHQGDNEHAIADYDEAIRLNPAYAPAYSNRGIVHRRQGALNEAVADYTQAISLDPEYAIAYNNRGLAYKQQGDLDRAIADYTQATSLDPDFADAFINRGLAHYFQGDMDSAIADYTLAISLDPEYAIAYNNRGLAYQEQGDLDSAITDYNNAIRLDPDYADAYNNRALARSRQNDLDGAIADFNNAIRLNPDYVTAYWGLGNAQYALQQFDSALTSYQRYLELAGENAIAFVIERVQELQRVLKKVG